MDMEQHQHRAGAGFPVDQPTEALKQDHRFVEQLFDRYLNTQSIEVKQEAGPQILQLLEMHAQLEESVFYPKVQSLAPDLVDHSRHEHQEVKDMIAQIRTMDPGDPQCEPLYRQLSESVQHHVKSEEQELFPKVLQSNLDLTALGLEMQAYEASMVSTQASQSGQAGMRQ